MEKVVYCVTPEPDETPTKLGDVLRGDVSARLVEAGAHAVQVNVADDEVGQASPLRISSSTNPAEAVISVWIDSASDSSRKPFDDAVAPAVRTMAAYLVTESVPVPNTRFPTEAGRRTEGMAQIAFLQRPEELSVRAWLDIWLNSHTQIAIDTQDSFLYVQNVVTRVLTEGATPWHAIVEEGFSSAAMTDPHVFFDAVDDDDRLARNQQIMFESVQRFIDLSRIDVLPTSRYVMRSLLTGS